MSIENEIENALEEIGLEPEHQATENIDQNKENPADHHTEFETITEEQVIPIHPRNIDKLGDQVHTYLLQNGSQASVTTKPRPQCPTCDYIVLNLDEEQPPSQCNDDDCTIWTCPSCQGLCQSCDNVLCPKHSTGHATKDETYCFDCVGDIDEQVRHQRSMERRQQDRQEMQEERQLRQQKWSEKKEAARLKLEALEKIARIKEKQQQKSGNPFKDTKNRFKRSKQSHSNAIDQIKDRFKKKENKTKNKIK